MKKLVLSTAVIFVLFFSFGQARADFDSGLKAYQHGDYITALQHWRPLARHGDGCAQYNIGFIYASGHGVPRDYSEAAKWYLKAAEQGYAIAQNKLAFMYVRGHGMEQNDDAAVAWWRRAAEQGHAEAQSNLAGMYAQGRGAPKNFVLAYMWVSLAAAQNPDPGIQRNLTWLEKQMTSTQLADAEQLARAWKPRSEATPFNCVSLP